MPSTVQPMVLTRDLPRLLEFYRAVLGATETERVPADGPVFYVGLRIGDSDLGLVAEAEAPEQPPRVLLSVTVDDVDVLLPRVTACGGTANPANDMPWGQRVAHVQDPDGNPLNLVQPL
ncbi:VOC family protein [Modestobacter marinus]|uniref:VOC family protein n=1 Tax=Modestobacter marinus TaxID=477641 RepID=UPI0027DF4B3E|nr:VOC family protein [Modestobacter marinus]